ncbi:kinase-like protein [Daedalea quercina L-15889]|uniref:Kinase-like protein n=1 Tax=Daedalea quercina L-15889 TaxID=1314783 RepID=A0A165TXR8_9APHY|nr:kinase-like protein [Daedalea quercina L-15889]
MFFSTLQNMVAHVHVACAPNRATLREAFDALKESSKPLFVSQPSRHIPLTPSTTVLTLLDASDVEASGIVAVPQVSGAVIVATVGLHHPSTAHPLCPQWFIKVLRKARDPAVPLLIQSIPYLPIDEDAPQSTASVSLTIPSPPRSSAAPSPSPSPTGAQLQSNRVSVGIQVSIPPSWPSGQSSSSLDSDPAFECLTPLTTDTALRAPQKPQPTTSGNSLGVPFAKKHISAHIDLDGAIRALCDKASNLVEQYEKAVECAKRLCELQVDLEDEASLLVHSDKRGDLDALTERSDSSPFTVDSTAIADEPARAEGDVIQGNPSPAELEANSADANNEMVAEDDSESSSEDADTDDGVAPRSLYNPYSTRNYRVHGLIGEGGFARVAQVEDDNGRFFAVKVHHKKIVYQRPDARRRLLREMQTMASVTETSRYKCLVRLEESWEDADNIYFVMPLCRATLMDYFNWKVRTGLADPVSEKRYCAEMVAAVALLHDRGIMHRDIKPENFLLDESGACVLADYGLAYSSRGARITRLKSMDVCGTQDYFAPEQRQGCEYNYKVDIWELGCVWIELLAKPGCSWTSGFGDDVFERESPEVIQAKLQKSVRDLLWGHPALNLLLWMVDVDPRNRPSTGHIMDDPWFSDIAWTEILYGSSYTHPYLPGYAAPSTESSHRYSTFDATKSPSLVLKSLLKKRFTEREQKIAALQIVQAQTDLFETCPEEFVYPPPIRLTR